MEQHGLISPTKGRDPPHYRVAFEKVEPRLRDAIEKLETLGGYPEPDAALYERAPSPEHKREPRSITCWNCGLTGHVASECPEDESEVS